MLFSVRVLQKLLTVFGHLGSWEITKGRGGGDLASLVHGTISLIITCSRPSEGGGEEGSCISCVYRDSSFVIII